VRSVSSYTELNEGIKQVTDIRIAFAIPIQPLYASVASIEKAWHLMQIERSLDIDVSTASLIVEIGGGYGQVSMRIPPCLYC
jgi:hypothetical protein